MSLARILRPLPAVAAALALAACAPCPVAQTQPAPAPTGSRPPAPLNPSRVQPGDTQVVDPPHLVEVLILTTQEGASGEFSPRVVRVRQGDLIRFRMADGNSIHTVSFASFNNHTGGIPLPPEGPYLTQLGQSWQIRNDLGPSTYEFACLPHVHQGHRGTLIVEP